MENRDDISPSSSKGAKGIDNVKGGGGVQTRRRLIKEQQGGVGDHLHPNVYPLPLPAADASRSFVSNYTVTNIVQLERLN